MQKLTDYGLMGVPAAAPTGPSDADLRATVHSIVDAHKARNATKPSTPVTAARSTRTVTADRDDWEAQRAALRPGERLELLDGYIERGLDGHFRQSGEMVCQLFRASKVLRSKVAMGGLSHREVR